MPSKPKLRMAPPPSVLADQQDAAKRLLLLDKWTEIPLEPPPSGLAATIALPIESAAPVANPKAPPEPPKKPWETPSADAMHPYHLVCPERLFQKIDFVWKRKGHKSMREWVLQTLEAEANKALKALKVLGE